MSNNSWAMTTLLWQLYDPQGRPIQDGGAPKLKAIMEGVLHGSAHVWIWRRAGDDIEVLVQRRAAVKINWPGRLDKSAGGHITYGEQPIEAAIRKAQVELGLELTPEQMQLAGVRYWTSPVDGADMVENEFQWIYIAELADPQIKVPTAEVEAVEWRRLDTLLSATNGSQYVPYEPLYFGMLSETIGRITRVAARR